MWKVMVILSSVTVYLTKCDAVLLPLEQPKWKVSLCDCILAAVKKYVQPKETITVASSITDYSRNVSSVVTSNQMVLSLITNEANWTILTTNMNKYSPRPIHYSLEKISKSYIIFIRSTGEISTNLRRLKTLNSWNPHSYFLITSASIFQDPFEVAYGILQTLYEEELLDGVVLLPNPKNISLVNVYIPRPYENGNCSRKLGKIEVMGSCTMGVYRIKRDLFMNNIPKRLSNCTLYVGYSKVEPLVMGIKNSSVKDYYHTSGLEINLVNVIANYLDIKLLYFEQSAGDIFLNGTATDNLLLLKQSRIDIAIGSYVKTFERSFYFDCSDTYMQDKLMWCVPHTPLLVNSQNFLNILDLTSWVLLIILYLIAVSLIWFVSRMNGKELHPYQDYKNVSQYIFSIFLGIPVRLQPRTAKIRVLFIFVVLFSFYLDSSYLSFLTSVLTGSRYVEKYSTGKDIYKYNLKTYFVPNSDRYFQGEKFQYILDKMIECDNYRECMDYVAFRRDSAFCVPKMYVDYIYNSYVSKNGYPLLHCFGNIVSLSINMLMRKGFPLFSKINHLIGRFATGGFITKWKKDILSAKAGNFVADIDISESNHFLKLKNLLPIFITLVVGHSLAFLVFIVELRFRRDENLIHQGV